MSTDRKIYKVKVLPRFPDERDLRSLTVGGYRIISIVPNWACLADKRQVFGVYIYLEKDAG